MPAYIDNKGGVQQVTVDPSLYSEARRLQLTVPQYLNAKYPDADPKHGTAAQQIFASEGLIVLNGPNPMGLKPLPIREILDGPTPSAASPGNVSQNGSPFGSQSRILFPAAVIAAVESTLTKDRSTDTVTFNQMVATTVTIDGETFEQPVVDYSGKGGPESAKAQRVAQLAQPPMMLRLTTSDRPRRIASHAIGLEVSDQALRSATLDMVALTMTRFFDVELDERVYRYISDLFSGNADLVVGAVSAVTSASLDSASTGGVLTHRAWVKWLARNRKYRKISHIICDIDTYLKIEGRTGRPGTNNYDPTLARIDPQARAANMENIGFGNDVKFFIVDSAAEGGPVPANTIYGLDSRYAVAKVINAAAAYQGSEEFALKRSTAMRVDWSEDVYRFMGDTDLRSFDALTISA